MSETFDLLIRAGIPATPNVTPNRFGVRARICAIGSLIGAKSADTFDSKGCHVLRRHRPAKSLPRAGNDHKKTSKPIARSRYSRDPARVRDANPPADDDARGHQRSSRVRKTGFTRLRVFVGATPAMSARSRIGTLRVLA